MRAFCQGLGTLKSAEEAKEALRKGLCEPPVSFLGKQIKALEKRGFKADENK